MQKSNKTKKLFLVGNSFLNFDPIAVGIAFKFGYGCAKLFLGPPETNVASILVL